MKKVDATLKKLFRRPPERLLALALGHAPKIARLLPTDQLAVGTRSPDLLYEDADGEIVHAELQGQSMPKFAKRNLLYYSFCLVDYDRPPIQIVFWHGSGAVGIPDGFVDPRALDYRYRVIDVREIDARILLESDLFEEAVFSILCRHEDPRAQVDQILERIATLPPEEQREAVAELLILSGLRGLAPLVREKVEQMPLEIDIHENQFLEGVFQKGREEGREEGGLAVARGTLREFLIQRFGPLDSASAGRVSTADLPTVLAWTRKVLSAVSLDDVFTA